MKRRVTQGFIALGVSGLLMLPAEARDLSFAERVDAQAAIERVYYAHQIGATQPFEEAVPREFLEEEVREYLGLSVALEEFWRTPVTEPMLRRETERMLRGTALPERLDELFSALGNDAFLVKECLARPVLVSRLTRNFFARDERIHDAVRREAEELWEQLTRGDIDPRDDHPQRFAIEMVVREVAESPAGEFPTADAIRRQMGADRWVLDAEEFAEFRAGLPARVGDVGPLRETDAAFTVSAVLEERGQRLEVASYSVPKVTWDAWWPRSRERFEARRVEAVADPAVRLDPTSTPTAGCVPDDTWDNGSLDSIPLQRTYHTAVWTGSEMIVWGGSWGGLFDTGGRYDPATDTWRPTSTVGAPSPRRFHTAVWTGTEMIVWGGGFNDGGRYDPVSDTWLPTSTVNAPSPTMGHYAVWTGHEMLVWGQLDGGGRYDPQTDTWRSITTLGAPSAIAPSVVWTGKELVVWGGIQSTTTVDTGARYDPVGDRWTSTSTTDAPPSRIYHSAVWTDSEMVVWGGLGDDGELRSGGRYDPQTDSWTATSTSDAPTARGEHNAVWTGTEVVVWGGAGHNTGGRYDPVLDRWLPTSTVNAPLPRVQNSVVWTGEMMIIWGGDLLVLGDLTNSGGRYDPLSDTWTPVSATTPTLRMSHSAVWTGSEMVVWGGRDSARYLDTGGRYDPATDAWTTTAVLGAPSARSRHAAAWTGSQMVVWGGVIGGATAWVNTGGRYDPRTDKWMPVSTVLAPSPRALAPAVWTGRELFIWGGTAAESQPPPDPGGRYDPATDTWRPISMIGAPSLRTGHSVVWTGREVLVWGGQNPTWALLRTGGAYDPRSDTWAATSTAGAPSARYGHAAVWTGQEMVVWGGGPGDAVVTGGRYDPAHDSWTPTMTFGAPSARFPEDVVWTGREMLVWGGFVPAQGGHVPATGGRYDPLGDQWASMSTVNAPSARYNHTAVWTGRSLIVWGGALANQAYLNNGARYFPDDSTDNDGDGFSACDGDCNDGQASVYPGAQELCDGLDQNCDGTIDEIDADGDGYFVCEDCSLTACDCDDGDPTLWAAPTEVYGLTFHGPDELRWQAPNAGTDTAFDVLRGPLDGFPVGSGQGDSCVAHAQVGTVLSVPGTPPPGHGVWYLVRSANACGLDLLGQGVDRHPVECNGCSHGVCQEGSPLDPYCSPCVSDICDELPSCCDTAWTASCAAAVYTACGSLVCPASTPDCEHGLCELGGPLTPGCDDPPVAPSCVSAVCDLDPVCCNPVNGVWDGLCLAEAFELCDLVCDEIPVGPGSD